MTDVAFATTLATHICDTSRVQGGVLKDMLVRLFICNDMFWWTKDGSPWRLNEVHPWTPLEPEQVSPMPRERALNLCEYKMTNEFFGLGFKDLMDLTVADFEEIEERVLKMAEETSRAQAKLLDNKTDLGKELKK